MPGRSGAQVLGSSSLESLLSLLSLRSLVC